MVDANKDASVTKPLFDNMVFFSKILNYFENLASRSYLHV
jgi:hypothetical protein